MPAVAARTLVLSPAEHLAWEPAQDVRHEYPHGEAFPARGGTSAHAERIVQLIVAFGVALRGTECTVRAEAMRVQITPDDYVYPDLTVTRVEEILSVDSDRRRAEVGRRIDDAALDLDALYAGVV